MTVEGYTLAESRVLGFSNHPPSCQTSHFLPVEPNRQCGGFAMNRHTQLKLSLCPTSSTAAFPAQPSPVVIHKPQALSGGDRLSLALRLARRDIADKRLNTLPAQDVDPLPEGKLRTPTVCTEPVPSPKPSQTLLAQADGTELLRRDVEDVHCLRDQVQELQTDVRKLEAQSKSVQKVCHADPVVGRAHTKTPPVNLTATHRTALKHCDSHIPPELSLLLLQLLSSRVAQPRPQSVGSHSHSQKKWQSSQQQSGLLSSHRKKESRKQYRPLHRSTPAVRAAQSTARSTPAVRAAQSTARSTPAVRAAQSTARSTPAVRAAQSTSKACGIMRMVPASNKSHNLRSNNTHHQLHSPGDVRLTAQQRNKQSHLCSSPPTPPHTNKSPPTPPHTNKSPLTPPHPNESPPTLPHPNESPPTPAHTNKSPLTPPHTNKSPPTPPHPNESPPTPPHTNESLPTVAKKDLPVVGTVLKRLEELEAEAELIRDKWRSVTFTDPLPPPLVTHSAPKQGSVGALSPGSVASVCRNQQNYLRYLEQTGTSKAGGFDPWAMAERIADGLLSEALTSVAKEVESVCSSCIDCLYSGEFRPHTQTT